MLGGLALLATTKDPVVSAAKTVEDTPAASTAACKDELVHQLANMILHVQSELTHVY